MTAFRRASQLTRHLRVMSSSPTSTQAAFSAPVSPVPANPLGEGNYVQTAACLIIGDEVLNGKTNDTNSHYLARLLFDLGIQLRRVEVVADDEEEIIEAARRMTQLYDVLVTSGGIGPTHDDRTYECLAKAFGNRGLEYHDETLKRMAAWSQSRPDMKERMAKQTEEQRTARNRMALLPGKLCILPGVPKLFERLCEATFARYIPLPPSSAKPYRKLISTKQPESNIAPYLTKLNDRAKMDGISVGSYPKFLGGVDVSLIGKDLEKLDIMAEEVCKELEGTIVEAGQLGEEGKNAPPTT